MKNTPPQNPPAGATPKPSADGAATPTPGSDAQIAVGQPTIAFSWFVVFFCFLPLNLVWLCAASSTFSAFGNRANLSNDRAGRRLRDSNNPYLASVLRGFFAYLFLISGLLLLDDSPFSNPAPAQYIRLAGFLSLLCFVVSYQPKLFNTLIVWAFHRIEVREGGDDESVKGGADTLHVRKTVEMTATQTPHPLHEGPAPERVLT